MEFHIAGGAVRDLLLGRKIRDIDYVFTDSEEEFIQRNPQARKTTSFPLPIYLLDGAEYTPLSGGSFATDMLRRDVTINALCLSSEGIIHAHPQCLADLRDRVLRPASPTAFEQDPVRVFRVARFAAMLPDFTVHPDCYAQMRLITEKHLLQGIAPERIGNELQKVCATSRPGNFLRVLAAGGCLAPWLIEMEGAESIVAGPPKWHDSSVLEHTARVMDGVAECEWQKDSDRENGYENGAPPHTSQEAMSPLDPAITKTEGKASSQHYMPMHKRSENQTKALAVWMALCHDLGKVTTSADVLPHHIGHEVRGEQAARVMGERLRLSRRYIDAGVLASRLHMKAGIYPTLRAGTQTDLLMQAHAAHILDPLFLLAAVDSGNADLPDIARRDCAAVLSVSLPPKWQNKGADSGRRLREMRCKILSKK